MPHLQVIFVPAWGWVGSVDNSNGFGDGTLFSSPSGDGLVPEKPKRITKKRIFSSPSGGGLVHKDC